MIVLMALKSNSWITAPPLEATKLNVAAGWLVPPPITKLATGEELSKVGVLMSTIANSNSLASGGGQSLLTGCWSTCAATGQSW